MKDAIREKQSIGQHDIDKTEIGRSVNYSGGEGKGLLIYER